MENSRQSKLQDEVTTTPRKIFFLVIEAMQPYPNYQIVT